jgi:hypothetical protein
MLLFLLVVVSLMGLAVMVALVVGRPEAAVRSAAPVPAAEGPEGARIPSPAPGREALVARLEAVGYFANQAPEAAARHRAALLAGHHPWHAESGRVHLYDEGELGECGPRELFEEARPFLEAQGVRLGVIQQKAVLGLQVELTIDGRREVLLEPGETDTLEEAAALVARRTFRLLNRLLESAGSPERAYRLRDDFDATVVFLTPDMWAVFQGVEGLAVPERA